MIGVKFGDLHSTDLNLEWLDFFEATPPEVVTNYVDIPGRNGRIDYSESITGYPTYKDRKITAKFILKSASEEESLSAISNVINQIHGKRMPVILDSEPDYQWDCRLNVESERNNRHICTVNITGDAYPYKRKTTDTVIEQTLTSTATDIICHNQAEPVVPTIETTGSTAIIFKGKRINVSAGSYILGFVFAPGENILTVSGTGKIKIIYREGSL